MNYTNVKQARPGKSLPGRAYCYFIIIPMYWTLTACPSADRVWGTMIQLLKYLLLPVRAAFRVIYLSASDSTAVTSPPPSRASSSDLLLSVMCPRRV